MQPSLRAALRSQNKIAIAALLVAPLLTGCIESETPLSKEKFVDDTIVGNWRGDDQSKNILELNITRTADGSYIFEERERNDNKPTNYIATLTHGSRTNYANVAMPHPSLMNGQKTPLPPAKTDAYMLFQYSIVNGKLHVWANDFEKLKESMQSKQISGTSNETTWGQNMLVTSDGAKLLKLFDATDGAKFFGEELVFSQAKQSESKSSASLRAVDAKHALPATAQPADIKQEVSATLQSQADAWNAGDLDKFMASYVQSKDITFVSSDGEMRGYDALQARYRKRYGTSKDTMGKLSFSDLEVTSLGDNNAMCVGNWLVERADKTVLKGMFTLILIKSDGPWKIIHDHTSLFPASK